MVAFAANISQLAAVHLTDCICLTQPSLYISNILLALRAMLQMDLPHVNVLTKIDKISSYDPLPFNLDYYTEVQDLTYLIPSLEEEAPAMANEKFSRLNRAIAEMVEQFGLVNFQVLAVENKKSMMHLLQVIDRANGYVFGSAEGANDTVWQVAMRNESSLLDTADIQDRWIDSKTAYDEQERLQEEQSTRLQESQAQAQAEAAGVLSDDGDDAPVDHGIRVARKKR
jgi:GPN-loop GTPase